MLHLLIPPDLNRRIPRFVSLCVFATMTVKPCIIVCFIFSLRCLGNYITNFNTLCFAVKFGNEECTATDKCPSGMTCKYGRCLCTGDGIMTLDRRSCLKPEHKLLGDSCSPGIDTCYQRRTCKHNCDNLKLTPLSHKFT